jgi:hypothetical protein
MVWAPISIVVTLLKLACPLPFSAADPSEDPAAQVPSFRLTLPDGVPPPGASAVTVTVKVTGSLKTVDAFDVVTAVVVLALFTTWLTSALLGSKPVAPP